MAGIIKRSNKWVAVFKTLDGKEVRKTTRIDVVPKVIPVSYTHLDVYKRQESLEGMTARASPATYTIPAPSRLYSIWIVSFGLPSPVRCLTERTGAGNGFFLPYGSVVMCNVSFWNGITEITSGWLRRPM